jgi:hypothetical protein
MISRVEVSFELFDIPLEFSLSFAFAFWLSVHSFVLFSFSTYSFLFFGSPHLVHLLDFWLFSLPHISDFARDFSDPVAGVLVLDLGVDVHAVQEECTHGLFRWLWLESFLFGHTTTSDPTPYSTKYSVLIDMSLLIAFPSRLKFELVSTQLQAFNDWH